MAVPYSLCTLSELEFKDEPLAFDIETIGFYGKIRLAQFYQESWNEVKLVENPDPLTLKAMLDQQHLLIQNASYEISTFQALLGVYCTFNKYDDIFYLARLKYFRNPRFSLDDILTTFLGYDPYEQEGLDKKSLQKSNWKVPVLTKEQKVYAALDVYHLPSLFEELKDYTEDISYKLDMLSLEHAVHFQTIGMPVLQSEVNKMYSDNLNKIEELDVPINVNSYQQVRPYIGSNMSDAIGLSTLAIQGNEKAKKVLEARKLLKQNSFLSKYNTADGKLYGKFAPSARSGRFTCKDQNLQQLPRGTKNCFGFDTNDGKVLVYADYAQLEMRCIAAITGDKTMVHALVNGIDLHNHVAEILFGKNFTPAQRQIAKTCNFNLLYGGGAKMLGSILIKDAGILLSEEELYKIKARWQRIFPGITAWQRRGISAWKNNQAWQTPMGRRYTAVMMTDQLNIMNQGFGAEVAKLALHYIYKDDILQEQVDGLANFVHDAFIEVTDAIEDKYTFVAKAVAEHMHKGWTEACKTGKNLVVRDLPMPVDVFVGYNWGKIESDYIYKYTLDNS